MILIIPTCSETLGICGFHYQTKSLLFNLAGSENTFHMNFCNCECCFHLFTNVKLLFVRTHFEHAAWILSQNYWQIVIQDFHTLQQSHLKAQFNLINNRYCRFSYNYELLVILLRRFENLIDKWLSCSICLLIRFHNSLRKLINDLNSLDRASATIYIYYLYPYSIALPIFHCHTIQSQNYFHRQY